MKKYLLAIRDVGLYSFTNKKKRDEVKRLAIKKGLETATSEIVTPKVKKGIKVKSKRK